MNERIKEIALNTNDACEHLGCSDIGEEWIEKFAELIVQECGIVADKWVDDEDNGKNLVSEKLKQYFGVE